MKSGRSGVTLIELLIGVVLITCVTISLSLLFPKVTKSVVRNRQRVVAANLANNLVETLKVQPYTLLETTPPDEFQSSTLNCNCGTDDFSKIIPTTSENAGTRYKVWSCVNYVAESGGIWTPGCPSGGDTGFKGILARVSWTQGSDTYTISQSAFKTRY